MTTACGFTLKFETLTSLANRNKLLPFFPKLIPEPLRPRTLALPACLQLKLTEGDRKMSIKRTIGTFVVLLALLIFAPQVNAGPVVALYGENAFGFTLRITHGAIVGPGVDVHAFMVAPPFSQF